MTSDVSILICTRDRPQRLRAVLESVHRQQSQYRFEVVVVDNNPASGQLAPLAQELDWVRFVDEPHPGLSRARNAGIPQTLAPVIVLADDDIEVPAEWLDKLVRPIVEEGYDVVTGPTLPLRLETQAEHLFEAYGGHGHARQREVFDQAWLAGQTLHLPLWRAGGFCNAAVSRAVFDRLGAPSFDPLLGAGTPAGSWEDLYCFYLMLRAGARILHEPAAWVWHAHREDYAGLVKQLCAYRRGEVCFCELLVARHFDLRAVLHLLVWVPQWRARLLLAEVVRRLRGQSLMPFSLQFRELLAYLGGPAALIASQRVSREYDS